MRRLFPALALAVALAPRAAAASEKVGLRLGSLALNQGRFGVGPGIGLEYAQDRGHFFSNVTRLEWLTAGGIGGLFIGEELRIFAPIDRVEVGGGVALGPLLLLGTGVPSFSLRIALGAGATVRFLDSFYGGLHYEFDLFPFFNLHTVTAQVGMAY